MDNNDFVVDRGIESLVRRNYVKKNSARIMANFLVESEKNAQI